MISARKSSTPHRSATTLILVRHGETESNVSQRWYGAMDAPLTERGTRQVAATAEAMVDVNRRFPVDAFYVSPLPRAQATANAIAKAIGVEYSLDDGLREFDLGDWEGRTFVDLRETEDLWGRWAEDPTFAPPNGESPASFSRRVEQVIQKLVDRHRGQTILIVSHGALIGNLLTRWFGEGPPDWRRWDPPNCSISVLQLGGPSDDEEWQPILVNDVTHLAAEERSGV